MKNRKLAIIGATGLVGQTILKVLEEKKLPITEYALKNFFFRKKLRCTRIN